MRSIERSGRDRWLISYADLVTLLLACFTTAYAASHVPQPEAPAEARTSGAPMVAVDAGDDATRATQAADPPAPVSVDGLAPNPGAARTGSVLEAGVARAIGTHPIEITSDVRGLVISMPDSAAFSSGSADLTPDAKAFLVALAGELRLTAARVRVEGHTDDVPISTGRYQSNWELSTARASAVVVFLVSATALAPERLSAAGYGQFHPRVPNDTPERRVRNRRVDLVVIDAATERDLW
jgi:chemotaxis protein MotB